MIRKPEKYIPGITALTLPLLLLLGSLLAPSQELLPVENRKAASMPAFSLDSWLSGDYAEGIQSYVNDHVAFRQGFIQAKCFVDELLLMQTEEDGILLGKDGQMFTKEFVSEEGQEQLFQNLDSLDTFAKDAKVPVTVMIVPSANTILSEKLPSNAPMEEENAILDTINDCLAQHSIVVDVRDTLQAHKNDYIYYRTDHHWTTLGAYYAYEAFCDTKGKEPFLPDWGAAERVEDFYGTHYAKTRYFFTVADTITYFPANQKMVRYKVTGDACFEKQSIQEIINTKQLQEYDKYAAFLDGNNGYSVIDGEGDGRILVVKDSYANCFVPFLCRNYEQIGVADYRNYAYNLSNLVEKEAYDEVLILYSFQGFAKDTGLVAINRPVIE